MNIRTDRTIRHTLAGTAALVLLAGCATLEREGVLATKDGGPVTVRNGAPLVVSLSPDPDIGYGWVLKSTGPGLSATGGPDVTTDPKPPSIMGVPDTTTFRFRAVSAGTTSIEFRWAAPPGQSTAAERTVKYDVTVTPSSFFGIL
ncbi:MAG: protease inhibitor I42 family protein [Betaproteobacteria bacterium]